MVLRAIWLGPDPEAADGLFENEAEALRRLTGTLTGHREGFLAPASISPVPGALSVSLPAYDAVVVGDGGVGERGSYFVTESEAPVVPCVPPTTGSRVDALVQCVRDNQYGAQPAAHPSVGPDLFFVAGTVIGTSPTPPTDAQVTAEVGPGGWFRVGNVRIDPGDTEVQPGNIDDFEVSGAEAVEVDTGWIALPGPSTPALINTSLFPPSVRAIGNRVYLEGSVQPAAGTTLGHGASWNNMWVLEARFRPVPGTLPTGSGVPGPESGTAVDGAVIGLRCNDTGQVAIVNYGSAPVPEFVDIGISMSWLTD